MNLQKIRLFLALLLAVYAFAFIDLKTGFSDYPSYALWDTLLRWDLSRHKNRRETSEIPLVIISIDEESSDKLQMTWPWSREVIAQLFEKLAPYKPRVTGFDLAFFGKSAHEEWDAHFLEALPKLSSTVFVSHFDGEGEYRLPYEPIRQAATRIGFLNLPLDRDEIIRGNTVVGVTPEGKVIAPSFALALAAEYLRNPSFPEILPKKRPFFLNAAGLPLKPESGLIPVPTDESFNVGTHYFLLPSEIPRISFWKALSDPGVLEQVRDKIVLVGVEDPALKDIFNTPFGPASGVSLHAVNALMFLKNSLLWKTPRFFFMLCFVGSAILGAFLLAVLKKWPGIFLCLGLIAALFLLSLAAFIFRTTFIDTSLAMMGVCFLILWTSLYEEGYQWIEILRLKNELARDPLTKAYNFRYLEMATMATLRRMKINEKISLLVLDVDHFKKINDLYGHPTGNEVLKILAAILRKNARGLGDVVTRFGGDEFCVLLHRSSEQITEKYLQRIMKDVADHLIPKFTISAGAAVASAGKFHSFKAFLSAADKMLYEAKQAGRNQYRIQEY